MSLNALLERGLKGLVPISVDSAKDGKELVSKKQYTSLCISNCIGNHQVKVELNCTQYAVFNASGIIGEIDLNL